LQSHVDFQDMGILWKKNVFLYILKDLCAIFFLMYCEVHPSEMDYQKMLGWLLIEWW